MIGVYMKKVAFSLGGRRFEIELESEFALYVEDDLTLNGIATDRDNELTKLLRAYLKALKQNYDNEKQIETLLVDILT